MGRLIVNMGSPTTHTMIAASILPTYFSGQARSPTWWFSNTLNTMETLHTSWGSFSMISTSDMSNPTDAGFTVHDNSKLHSSSLQNVSGITCHQQRQTVNWALMHK